MNNETETTTATPKKWTACPSNPPGPIQVKKFNRAMSSIATEHNTKREKWGVIGGEEHESCMVSIFGVNRRDDVTKVQVEIGERYGWTVTKANVNQIIAEMEAALPELSKNRPCEDKRRTLEQDTADREEMRQHEATRLAKQAERDQAAAKIAGQLRTQFPWARPESEKMSNHARAAANAREELSRTFAGHSFSVRSDYNSLRVAWDLGPDEKSVETVLEKYKNGHWDGMTDSHEYDNSAHGKACEDVFGRVTYVSLSRSYDTAERSRLLAPVLCGLLGVEYNPSVEPWNQQLPGGDHLGSAIRIILANQSFPPGATITGLQAVESDEEVMCGNDWHKRFQAVFTVAQGPDTTSTGNQSGSNGVLGSVKRNIKHNGVEIAFNDKPTDDLRYRLQRAGFRITRRPPWKWYQKFSEAAWAKACELAGVDAACPTTGAGDMDVAHENETFDAVARAIGA